MKIPGWVWMGLIVVLVFGLWWPVSPRYRPVPSDDPSVFLYSGASLLRGGMPYHAAWDHKQPLAYLLYALSLLITPHSLWGIWLIELLGLALTGLLAYRMLVRAAPPLVSFLAVAAGLLTLVVILWGYSLEELALPLQVLVLYAFARLQRPIPARAAAGWGLAAGLAAGAAFFLKQSLAAAGLAVGLYLALEMLFYLWQRRSWRGLTPLLGMAAGFLLVAVPLALYLWRGGALADYRDAVLDFNLAYAGLGPLERVKAVWEAVQYQWTVPGLFLTLLLWLAAALTAVLQAGPLLAWVICLRAFRPLTLAAGGGLVLLSFAAEWLGSEPGFGMAQWAAVLAGAALLLAGLLLPLPALRERLARALNRAPLLQRPLLPEGDDAASRQDADRQNADWQNADRLQADRLRLALLWLVVLFYPILLVMVTLSGRNYVYYFIPLVPFLMLGLGLAGGILADRLQGARLRVVGALVMLGLVLALSRAPANMILGGLRAPANPPLPRIVAYVQSQTAADDTILAWGKYITYVYFLADRQAPTRYFYQAPLALDDYNARHHVADEVLRDLQARPPRLFLLYSESSAPPPAGKCPLPASNEPNSAGRIYAFVCAHYQYATSLDEFMVYRLK